LVCILIEINQSLDLRQCRLNVAEGLLQPCGLCDALPWSHAKLCHHDRFRGHGSETSVEVQRAVLCDGRLEGVSVLRVSVYAYPVHVLISGVVGGLVDSGSVRVCWAPHKEDVGSSGVGEDVSDTDPGRLELSGCVAVHSTPGVPVPIKLVKRSQEERLSQ